MLSIDQVLYGRYRVVEEIGQGGFGRVYLADELERGAVPDRSGTLPLGLEEGAVLRQVAIKAFSEAGSFTNDFKSELRALCRLSHPNIVSVFDYNMTDPALIVMEYVRGRDLESVLRSDGPMSLVEGVGITRQVASALAHAHRAGVLHRDIKPSNVIVSGEGRARLLDFGLAREHDQLGKASVQVGTPGFVAPELLAPDRFRYPVGIASDVYGAGCFLHALLTGVSPFAGDGPVETLRHQLDGRRMPVDALHPMIRSVVERATALVPSERYPSLAPFIEALERIDHSLHGVGEVAPAPVGVDLPDAQITAIEAFKHPVRGPGIRFALAVGADGTVHRGFAYESGGRNPSPLFDALLNAPEGAELSLFDAHQVTSAQKGTFLTGGLATTAVLEPHLLLSVTDMVRTRGVRSAPCPTRYFADLRQKNQYTIALFRGRLIHLLFDSLIEDRSDRLFAARFDDVFAGVRVEAVAAKVSDGSVNTLRDEIEAMYAWLQGFMASNMKTAKQSVEVTRYSGRYGLEGRIDLVMMGDGLVELVELKSGKFQSNEHTDQVRAYSLLWDDFAASLGRSLRARLVYSKTGHEKGVSRLDHAAERRLLHSRNGVVRTHLALARGDHDGAMPVHNQHPDRCRDNVCRFRQDRCRSQSALLHDTTGAARPEWHTRNRDLAAGLRRYYWHFVTLVEREYLAQSASMGQFTRPCELAGRVESGTAVGDLTIVDWDAGADAVRIAGRRAGRFPPGRDVVLHRGDPDRGAVLVGRVASVGQEEAVIRSKGVGLCEEVSNDGWTMEARVPRIGFREAHSALYHFIETATEEDAQTILFGTERAVESGDQSAQSVFLDGFQLNDEQRAAVALAVGETRPVLVHGPPGTGKTTVIGAMVGEMVGRGLRVLVAAGTNTAVDNILEHLARAEVDFLRLGRLTESSGLNRVKAGFDPVRQVEGPLGRSTQSLDALAARLAEVRVVAGTAHKCITSPVIASLVQASDGKPFDVVVVDEATQLTEPLCLGPLVVAKRFVLVGDERQLPPVVSAANAVSLHVDEELREVRDALGLRGLEFTLFERLIGLVPEASLRVQYRMNEAVQALSNRLYYDGALRAAPAVATRRLEIGLDQLEAMPPAVRARLDPEQPVAWETCLQRSKGERVNSREVDAVIESVVHLLAARPDLAGDIGVISPFRAQCHALREALRERLGDAGARQVEVDTVERFQGREKEVMFVSLVVATWSDFVMDARRLNVAFTRARSKLVVFGPQQLWWRFQTSGEP